MKCAKLVLLSVLLFSAVIVAYAQEPNPNFNQELDQETPTLVPFRGGIGRIMRLGFQPVNLSAQAYVNAKRPDVLPSPTWQLKFQIAFLYPKRPPQAAPAK